MEKYTTPSYLTFFMAIFFGVCQSSQAQQKLARKVIKDTQSINRIAQKTGKPPCSHCGLPFNKIGQRINKGKVEYITSWLKAPGLCKNKRNLLPKEKKLSKKKRYKACYKRAQNNFNKSIKYINMAASSFKINPNHLACLLLQESQFLENAASGTGPIGLAQYSNGTLKTMQAKLQVTLPKTCTKKRKKVSCTGKNKRKCRRDLAFCNARRSLVQRKENLLPKWKSYIKSLRPNTKKTFINKSNNFCSNQKTCRKNIYWSIGAAALYIKEIQDHYLKDYPTKDKKEFFLMASALYNPGPGTIKKVIPKSTSRGWEKNIKIPEAKKYVKRIRRCIEHKLGQKISKK